MKFMSTVTALWFALMAGFFFAFSTTVMPGLAALSAEQGMSAMQAINAAVRNPGFAAGFWVALLLAGAGAAYAVFRRAPGWIPLLAGCLVYLAGVFGTTAAGNVPMNRALALLQAGAPDNPTIWADYQADWTMLNHLRMAAAFVAAGLVLVPLIFPAGRQAPPAA